MLRYGTGVTISTTEYMCASSTETYYFYASIDSCHPSMSDVCVKKTWCRDNNCNKPADGGLVVSRAASFIRGWTKMLQALGFAFLLALFSLFL